MRSDSTLGFKIEFRILSLILMIVYLFNIVGCTATCHIIGNAFDESNKEFLPVEFEKDSLILEPGTKVLITLKDGTVLEKKVIGIKPGFGIVVNSGQGQTNIEDQWNNEENWYEEVSFNHQPVAEKIIEFSQIHTIAIIDKPSTARFIWTFTGLVLDMVILTNLARLAKRYWIVAIFRG